MTVTIIIVLTRIEEVLFLISVKKYLVKKLLTY